MLTIDKIISREKLEQFAEQARTLHPELRENIEKNFKNDQSADFYKGLIAAYANACVLIGSIAPDSKVDKTVKCITAHLADKILKKGYHV